MTLAEKATYIRAFQKAQEAGAVRSRLIRDDARLQDALAELVRAALGGNELFRVWKARGTYRVACTRSVERTAAVSRLRERLDQRGAVLFAQALNDQGTWRRPREVYVTVVDEGFLAQALVVRSMKSEIELAFVPERPAAPAAQAPPPPPRVAPPPRPETRRLSFAEALEQTLQERNR